MPPMIVSTTTLLQSKREHAYASDASNQPRGNDAPSKHQNHATHPAAGSALRCGIDASGSDQGC